MGRKPRFDRSPEEKRQIVQTHQEWQPLGGVSPPRVDPDLYYRRKGEAAKGTKAALGVKHFPAGKRKILEKRWESGLRRGSLPNTAVVEPYFTKL